MGCKVCPIGGKFEAQARSGKPQCSKGYRGCTVSEGLKLTAG
jgi:hypothetical protein